MHPFVAALQSVTDSCTALGHVLDALFCSFCMVPRTEDMFLTPSAMSHPEGCSGGSGLVHHISFPADTWIPTAPNIWVGPSDSCCPLRWGWKWCLQFQGGLLKCLEILLAVGQMQRILGMILRSQQIKEPQDGWEESGSLTYYLEGCLNPARRTWGKCKALVQGDWHLGTFCHGSKQ